MWWALSNRTSFPWKLTFQVTDISLPATVIFFSLRTGGKLRQEAAAGGLRALAPGQGKAKAGMLLILCLSLLSLPKAKRKLDLEGIGRPTGPEFRTPKGKCIRVDGLPSPKSKIPMPMGYYLKAGSGDEVGVGRVRGQQRWPSH